MSENHIYMKVSKDKYEFPLVIADSVTELARMVGTTRESISSNIYHSRKKGRKCCYIKVVIEKDDDTEIYETFQSTKRNTVSKSIDDVLVGAGKEGLSYGQYVARHKLN